MAAITRGRGPVVDVVEQERKRQNIVSNAAQLFEKDGYHRVSMTDIANAVDLAKPSLYHYYKSKADILFAIHEQFFDPRLAAAEAVADMPPREALHALIVDMMALMDTHRPHLRTVFEHHGELEGDQRTTVLDKRDRYEQILQDVLARGVKAGDFRKINPRLSALAVFGMCNWAYQWYKPGGTASAEIADVFFDLLTNGLNAPARAKRGS
jgi:AcrR family transcriptional regulator